MVLPPWTIVHVKFVVEMYRGMSISLCFHVTLMVTCSFPYINVVSVCPQPRDRNSNENVLSILNYCEMPAAKCAKAALKNIEKFCINDYCLPHGLCFGQFYSSWFKSPKWTGWLMQCFVLFRISDVTSIMSFIIMAQINEEYLRISHTHQRKVVFFSVSTAVELTTSYDNLLYYVILCFICVFRLGVMFCILTGNATGLGNIDFRYLYPYLCHLFYEKQTVGVICHSRQDGRNTFFINTAAGI